MRDVLYSVSAYHMHDFTGLNHSWTCMHAFKVEPRFLTPATLRHRLTQNSGRMVSWNDMQLGE